jgi:hypothetical protein
MISFKGIKGLSQYNKKVIQYLSDNNLQQSNKWDFLVFRNPFSVGAPSIGEPGFTKTATSLFSGVTGLVTDALVTKVFVTGVNFHAGIKFQSERASGDFFVKDLDYPETCTVSFLDTEEGYAMRYLQDWINDVAEPADLLNTKKGYIFKDAQEYAKRTGILLLGTSDGKSLKYPRIMFYGMVPTSIGDISVSQDEGGNLKYTATFAIREIRIPRLI